MQVFHRLSDLPAGAWATLTSGPGAWGFAPFMLAPFESYEPIYLLIIAADEAEPLAGALLYECREPGSLPPLLFGHLASDRLPEGVSPDALYPALMVGPRRGSQNSLLVRPGLSAPARSRALQMLLRAIGEIAEEGQLRVVAFPALSTSDVMELSSFAGAARPSYHLSNLCLPVPASMDAHWSRFSKKRRYNMQREETLLERAGCTIEEVPASTCMAAIERLDAANTRKYFGDRWELVHALNMELVQNAPDEDTRVFLARKDGQVVGYSIIIRIGRVFMAPLFSAGEERFPAGTSLLAPLLFYAPLRQAVQEGIELIDYGVASEKAKLLRGCRVDPRSLVLWPLRDGPWEQIDEYLETYTEEHMRYMAACIEKFGRYEDQLQEDFGEVLELYFED